MKVTEQSSIFVVVKLNSPAAVCVTSTVTVGATSTYTMETAADEPLVQQTTNI